MENKYDLSRFAVSNEIEKLRVFNEENENYEYREPFQIDRDRILYSKEFRRLSGKTQVFVTGFDDHLRTRLTHTLEVSQIANTISNMLKLNTSLCEAIAYGHDVGHTPFGHVGERVLNDVMNGCMKLDRFSDSLDVIKDMKGFKHNLQGIRVVDSLERHYNFDKGLNLTEYTKWGILNHTSTSYKKCEYCTDNYKCGATKRDEKCSKNGIKSVDFYNNIKNNIDYFSLEAIVVAWADEIAQRHHDLEDGIYAFLINNDEARKEIKNIKSEHCKRDIEFLNKSKNKSNRELTNKVFSKFLIDNMVKQFCFDLNQKVEEISKEEGINSLEDLKNYFANNHKGEDLVKYFGYNEEYNKKQKKLQDFLKERILDSYTAQAMDGKAKYIIRCLFKAYVTNPMQLPDSTIKKLYANLEEYNVVLKKEKVNERSCIKKLHSSNYDLYNVILLRTITDFIAGMTDKYAMKQFDLLYSTEYSELFR